MRKWEETSGAECEFKGTTWKFPCWLITPIICLHLLPFPSCIIHYFLLDRCYSLLHWLLMSWDTEQHVSFLYSFLTFTEGLEAWFIFFIYFFLHYLRGRTRERKMDGIQLNTHGFDRACSRFFGANENYLDSFKSWNLFASLFNESFLYRAVIYVVSWFKNDNEGKLNYSLLIPILILTTMENNDSQLLCMSISRLAF